MRGAATLVFQKKKKKKRGFFQVKRSQEKRLFCGFGGKKTDLGFGKVGTFVAHEKRFLPGGLLFLQKRVFMCFEISDELCLKSKCKGAGWICVFEASAHGGRRVWRGNE